MGIFITIFILLACAVVSFGQTVATDHKAKIDEGSRPTTISLLSHYYDQDGEHGAINGGSGSQKLESTSQEAHIYIPKLELSGLSVNVGIDHFTSESLRFIDKYKTSASATAGNVSADETRYYTSLTYDFGNKPNNSITTLGAGYSQEYDVKSYSAFLGWGKELPKKNWRYQFGFSFVADRWLVIYPGEFRTQILGYEDEGGSSGGGGTSHGGGSSSGNGSSSGGGSSSGHSGRPAGEIDVLSGSTGASNYTDSTYGQIPLGYATPIEVNGKTDTKDGKSYPVDWRYSYNISNKLTFAINQKMNGAVGIDLTYQKGLLSTPFYRVYFNDGIVNELDKEVRIEKLPRQRMRAALYGRYNYHFLPNFVLRTQARYYIDNWNIQGITASVEAPIKVNNILSLTPFYRVAVQQGTPYFAAYGEHVFSPGNFYTSDYDLSSFTSQKIGGSIRIAPLKPIIGVKAENGYDYLFSLASASFRYGYYTRTDGFHAHSFSLELNFNFY